MANLVYLTDAGMLQFYSSAPMAMTAHDEMKLFWKKNQELKRPNSPWWIYRLCTTCF